MAYIRTVPPEAATGLLAELYEKDRATYGFVPPWSRATSLRPEATAAWRNLISTISSQMDLRRYELVTIAAATRLRCSA